MSAKNEFLTVERKKAISDFFTQQEEEKRRLEKIKKLKKLKERGLYCEEHHFIKHKHELVCEHCGLISDWKEYVPAMNFRGCYSFTKTYRRK